MFKEKKLFENIGLKLGIAGLLTLFGYLATAEDANLQDILEELNLPAPITTERSSEEPLFSAPTPPDQS